MKKTITAAYRNKLTTAKNALANHFADCEALEEVKAILNTVNAFNKKNLHSLHYIKYILKDCWVEATRVGYSNTSMNPVEAYAETIADIEAALADGYYGI